MKNKIIKTLIIALVLLFLTINVYAATCPNQVCESGEEYRNCPQDCPPNNSQPKIISEPVIKAEAGKLYTYWVEATDPDGDNVDFALGKSPQGMQIRNSDIVPSGNAYGIRDYDNKGEILWMPEQSQSIPPNNVHEVEVIANDMNAFQTSISEKQVFRVTVRMPSVCGNNVVEEGEICDGGDFSGKTCKSEGFTAGELKCSKDCKNFVTESCSSSQCKDISKQVKDCVESGGQDVTSLDGSGCLVFNECRQSSEVQVRFTKIEKGVIIQIKDNEANIEQTEQEMIRFGLRVNSAIFNVDAAETDVNSGVFEAQIKFRRANLLNGFFYFVTGFFISTPVTYLDVFEGEKLIVVYKGLSVEYVSEGGMQKCSQEYLAQAEVCEKQGNIPVIEVNKYGCKELIGCNLACPEIYAEINQCINNRGTAKFGRDNNNCPIVEECELPPVIEEPKLPEEKELTPPSETYCSFNKPEEENLDLIEISNVGFKGVNMPKSRIEFEVKNKGYSGDYVISINAYKFVGNEYLSTYNTFTNTPIGETKMMETDYFIKTEIFDQRLVFEVIGVNGKLLGKKEHELVAPLY